ncbi:hypothetical protein HY993_03695 [Candidatus Micrarchaeota archaeon]|nr:hypothetical protein [Candidatus Micrarchaeota archaeon]
MGGKYFWHKNPGLMAKLVRQLYDAGHKVNARAMKGGEKRTLYTQAIQVRPWDEILEKAGLEPKEIRGAPPAQRGVYSWRESEEKALARIRELHAEKTNLGAKRVKRSRGELGALWNYFSRKKTPWGEALRKAGLEPTKILARGGWAWRHDEEAIAQRIKELHNKGHKVNPRAMELGGEEKQALYRHATKKLGLKWDYVLKKAGLKPELIRMDLKSMKDRGW